MPPAGACSLLVPLLLLAAAGSSVSTDVAALAGHAGPTLSEEARGWLASPAGQAKRAQCLPVDRIPTQGRNLTQAELALLPSLCWRRDLQPPPSRALRAAGGSRGIPAGVRCNATQWCDGDGNCSEVCARGSVEVEPWLANALRTQLAISRQQSFCNATLPGTHNSGITLADGYGNLDLQFQEYFKWIAWVADDATLRTNDHLFSLTDQLNLGVRSVELDTHEVQGALRIAHCGGYHGQLDYLIGAVNVVAKLLGHPIHWDTETIGCNPSLSSIPVAEQRTFLSALQEIAAWLQRPGNEREFLVLYLDDQADLAQWGALPELFREIQAVFPLKAIFTPVDLDGAFNGTWPSIDQISALGKKLLFVTGYDYGPLIDGLMFSKSGRRRVCHWREPDFSLFQGQPACLADGNPFTGRTLEGTLFRQLTCNLFYGPMNCDFVWSPSNDPLLDEESLPGVYSCGVNMPSPDLLTPAMAATTIWSWAPGQPASPSAASGLAGWLPRWLARLLLSDEQACAAISAADGRWRAVPCGRGPRPTACRNSSAGQGADAWLPGSGGRGECPGGCAFELPRSAKENALLRAALQRAGAAAAWLPLQGPDWAVPGSPLYGSQTAAAAVAAAA